jgi:hypothetical protein
MTREEYDERRRRLDEQLRAGVELLEAAHRQQVRALDLVWMTTAEGDVELRRFPAAAPSPSVAQTAVAAPAPPASPPKPRRRSAGQLQGEVRSVLPGLPELFDRNDVCRVLGHEPERGTLYRVLQELQDEGLIGTEHAGSGRTPTRYRRLRASGPPS